MALYKEMFAETKAEEQAKRLATMQNGSKAAPTQEEQMQQVAAQFPTLKGFFR